MDHDYHLSSFLLYAAARSTLTQVYSTRGWRGDLRHALKIVFEFQNVFKKYFDLKKRSSLLTLFGHNIHLLGLTLILSILDNSMKTKDILTCKGHDTVVSLSAGDDTRPAEA
jgi:hypothetical protein